MEVPCRICCMPYDQNAYAPRILGNCGHTMCATCIDRSIKVLRETFPNFKHLMLKCPFDNKEHLINDQTTAESFPKNFELIEIMNEGFRRKSSANIILPGESEKKELQPNPPKATAALKTHTSLKDSTSPNKEWTEEALQKPNVNLTQNQVVNQTNSNANPIQIIQAQGQTVYPGRETGQQRMQSYTVSRADLTDGRDLRPTTQDAEFNSTRQIEFKSPEKIEHQSNTNIRLVQSPPSFSQSVISAPPVNPWFNHSQGQRFTVPAYLPTNLQTDSNRRVTDTETYMMRPTIQQGYSASLTNSNKCSQLLNLRVSPNEQVIYSDVQNIPSSLNTIGSRAQNPNGNLVSTNNQIEISPLNFSDKIPHDVFPAQNQSNRPTQYLKQTTNFNPRQSVPQMPSLPGLQRHKSENPNIGQLHFPHHQLPNAFTNSEQQDSVGGLNRNSSESYFKPNLQPQDLPSRAQNSAFDYSLGQSPQVRNLQPSKNNSFSQIISPSIGPSRETPLQSSQAIYYDSHNKLDTVQKPIQFARFFSSNLNDKPPAFGHQANSNISSSQFANAPLERSLKPQDIDFARGLDDQAKH
jgi:hypothetical protein